MVAIRGPGDRGGAVMVGLVVTVFTAVFAVNRATRVPGSSAADVGSWATIWSRTGLTMIFETGVPRVC